MKAGLVSLALIVCGGVLFALWRTVRRPIVTTWRLLGRPGKVVVTSLCAVCIFLAGGKNEGLRGTGDPSVTSEEIAQGYRLESAVTNDAVSYSMPTDGVEYARWSIRGGSETRFAFDLGDFYFPFGTGVVHRFDILSGGTIESLPRPSLATICAAREWASLVPGEGRFWWADAAVTGLPPYQGTQAVKLLTWEGVYAGRDRTGQYNAQIELRAGGDFAIRSNNVECVYRRVQPFDWDDDGLENSVDPDPLTAGPDAHGTNAEWYNMVCSNVLSAVASVELSWLEGVNSNAYYFVDVVAEHGPAPIYFTGDRDSRLGNPVVVALAGETNHVPLLIGVSYAVTSTVPFSVSVPDEYMYPEVQTNETCRATIRWPLNFVFTEGFSSGNRIYTIDVVPYDPGGTFSWETRGGSASQGGLRGGGECSCLSCNGRTAVYSCSASCACGGNCEVRDLYSFEEASFAATGGMCRCGFDDPEEPPEPPPGDPPSEPSLSVSFSADAIIFENAYEHSPGKWKPRRSTRVRLTVDAHGGSNGGSLSLSSANLGKLSPVAGGTINLPQPLDIAAYGSFHTTCVYEGAEASVSAGDVSVSGTFTETGTGQTISQSNSLSVVCVELQPRVAAPKNIAVHRHTYGVCELVRHLQAPSTPVVTWNPVGGGSNEMYAGSAHYRCPLDGCVNPLRAEIGSVHYAPLVEVVEPEGVESSAVHPIVYSNAVHTGEAGGIGMKLHLYITPLDVSFSEIAVEEVPCLIYETEGYFKNPYYNYPGAFAHTVGAGAGTWDDVNLKNKFAKYDEAAYTERIPWLTPEGHETTNPACAWTEGYVYVNNPFGWHVKGTRGETPPYKMFGEDIRATFMLDRQGRVGVLKLDNRVERTTNDVVRLYGPKEEEESDEIHENP